MTKRGILALMIIALVPTAATSTAQESPTVVSQKTEWPPKHLYKTDKFRPTATPEPGMVRRIIRIEQRIWGGPSIAPGVSCESTYAWSATNGSYRGLIQAGSIWGYLWSGTPRKVMYKTLKNRKRPSHIYTDWSNGSTTVERGRARRQIVHVRHRGYLPRSPSAYHGWAAVRVGQRAAGGQGRTTYWACTVGGSHYW